MPRTKQQLITKSSCSQVGPLTVGVDRWSLSPVRLVRGRPRGPDPPAYTQASQANGLFSGPRRGCRPLSAHAMSPTSALVSSLTWLSFSPPPPHSPPLCIRDLWERYWGPRLTSAVSPPRQEGCKFGAMCTFCHAAGHDDYVRARPCRAKRQRLRRVIAKI